MARHVGERLLHDPEHGGSAVAAENGMSRVDPPLDVDTVPVRKVDRQPVYGRNQPQVVEHHGPQVGGNPAHRGDGRIDQALHAA
jgi:hypothetical protein